MDKPDWKDAPEDATHRHSKSTKAHWYRMIGGKWHYYRGNGKWRLSTGLWDITNYLEPRP